jgi:hypothetical protein
VLFGRGAKDFHVLYLAEGNDLALVSLQLVLVVVLYASLKG